MSRTLLRKQTKERVILDDGSVIYAYKQDRPQRRPGPNAYGRNVVVKHQPTQLWPYLITYHPTKGYRTRRTPV